MQDKGITDELRHRGTNDCVLNVIVLDSDFYSFEYLDAEDLIIPVVVNTRCFSISFII